MPRAKNPFALRWFPILKPLQGAFLFIAIFSTLAKFQGMALAQGKVEFDRLREKMVEEDIVAAGIKNTGVIDAIRETPRHEFVPLNERKNSYYDMALPIGKGQTISAPFIVAYMTEALDPQPSDKVLEIGTGSGYQAAVLAGLVKEVYSIEIVEPLGVTAAKTLKKLGYENVYTKIGDGFLGWEEHAPFDKIIVTCSPEKLPEKLVEQLAEGGKIVVPLGERYQQTMYLFTKSEGKMVPQALTPTLFVPMTGLAEDTREVQPDPNKPALINTSFEEIYSQDPTENETKKKPGKLAPVGWHYLRLFKLVEDPLAPQGTHYLQFENSQPGRACQGLQAFAVDGRHVKAIRISARVKKEDVEPGPQRGQLPRVEVTFYDERRTELGRKGLGPFRGTSDWQEEEIELAVPIKAREAIVCIGLMGATGKIGYDLVQVEKVEPSGKKK